MYLMYPAAQELGCDIEGGKSPGEPSPKIINNLINIALQNVFYPIKHTSHFTMDPETSVFTSSLIRVELQT